jgi:hypothetical protein
MLARVGHSIFGRPIIPVAAIPRVRQMIDWLVEAFKRFPWVKDEFIHPSELNAVYKGIPLPHLFGGFQTEGR